MVRGVHCGGGRAVGTTGTFASLTLGYRSFGQAIQEWHRLQPKGHFCGAIVFRKAVARTVAGHKETPIMSNRTKAAGTRRRHAPQHRKEPSWTVSDLAAMPGGLGAKIVVTGVAGATLALPATSAFASPSSIPTSPGPGLISVTRAAGQGTAFRVHPIAGHGRNRATHGAANQGIHVRPTVAASDPAGPAAPGPGLLLEPNGTFMTLPQSAANVHTVPAGSLLITSNGIMMRPLSGTYATIYGLITVSQAPGSGTPLAAGMTPGTVSVNPGGPLQAPAGAPAAFGAGPVAPTLTPASVTTPTPIATPTPVAT